MNLNPIISEQQTNFFLQVHVYGVYLKQQSESDSVMALYRTTVSSKKYYHRIFFYLMDLMCVNA